MGSSPSVTTVKKEPYAYDPWFNTWASGLNSVLMGTGSGSVPTATYSYTPVQSGSRSRYPGSSRNRSSLTPGKSGTVTMPSAQVGSPGNPGLFGLMSEANRQYADLSKDYARIYGDAMSGYQRLANGQLDEARKAVIDRQLNDAMKTAIGDRLTQWADRGVMGGTTVSDSMGELSREAADTWMRNYFQALADERAAYDAMLSGYNTATTAALKPYTVLDPVMEGFSRIHSDYYNDPQDTVVSGGK